MSTYEPGTVAIATVRKVEGVRVWRTAFFNWVSERPVCNETAHVDRHVTDIRPLVVLDLDESVGKSNLPNWLRNNAAKLEVGVVSPSSFFKDMNWLADQIEAQTKPPRIPEPGLWGVVQDATANLYVRWSSTEWRAIGARSYGIKWDDIHDPALVRPGIEDEIA